MHKVIKGAMLCGCIVLCALWCMQGLASPAWLNWCALVLLVTYALI